MRLLVAAALLSIVCSLQAEDLRPLQQLAADWLRGQFEKYDKNGDGQLSADESKRITAYVQGADSDADGFVSLPELQALMQSRGGAALKGAARKALAKVTRPAPAPATALPAYKPEQASPRQEPRRIKAADAGVGRMVPNLEVTTLGGRKQRLAELAGEKATVIALVSTSCPVSKRYLPSLGVLQRETEKSGVSLLLVSPTATESIDELRSAFAAAKLSAPCAVDHDGALCRALGANVSTDVLVLDAKRTVVYHGALDDQYGLGYSLDAPRHRYVADALAALRDGRVPTVQATEAPGCVLDFSSTTATRVSDLTYHNRISRILQANCLECHRAGGVAPFGLETPEQVAAKAGMIRKMVERQLMPPWFAAAPEKGGHTPWMNDRSLAERDREDLLSWLANGRPLGDSADAPIARTWPADWQIGAPDAVFQIPKPIDVRATGTMPYQVATVSTSLAEDKWVQAVEIKPTAREVVHHVLVFVKERGASAAALRVARDEEGGGFFAAYVPGNDHVTYPDGFAKPLPAGATLVFQIHYTPNGTATQDQLALGVRFASGTPAHVIQVAGIGNHRISIPAGAEHHPESATIPIPREVVILGFLPHMHLRGKAFRYDLIQPDGSERTLLDIPRYDFNWQLAYRYAEPLNIRAGSRIRATGWFDNSAGNPANPDPTKVVKWGPQTFDEMMLGYVEYYVPGAPVKVARN